MSEEEFDAAVETNLKGCFHTIRHLSRSEYIQEMGGHTVIHRFIV